MTGAVLPQKATAVIRYEDVAIENLKNSIQKKTILFSEKERLDVSDYPVFIIDTISILSKIYSYADIVFVGGAVGNTGLHNTLEAAVFGVPSNYWKKSQEIPRS